MGGLRVSKSKFIEEVTKTALRSGLTEKEAALLQRASGIKIYVGNCGEVLYKEINKRLMAEKIENKIDLKG